MERLGEHQAGIFDSLARMAQKSEVMREMPDTGQEFVRALADAEIAPKQIFVAPEKFQEVFFQSQNPELLAAAEAMGVTPESLEENLALGTDVALDVDKAATQIFQDDARYQALKADLRMTPEMPSQANLEELQALESDMAKRAAYIEDILGPVAEEAQAAQSRYETRMEIARPYVEQLKYNGYSDKQAEAYGLVLAANAERMAPVFGQSPAEYLQKNLAGYYEMSQGEFEQLGQIGLDEMFENPQLADLLQDMGVTRGMSKAQRRRKLSPEFDYVYGRVSPESVQALYGMERYKELRRQFGPGFFAKKGEGMGIDVLAHGFMSDERGGYDLNRDAVDVDEFAETVFAPHDEFERGMGGMLERQALWQRDGSGNVLAPGETSPRIAQVVEIDPAQLVDDAGKPLNWKSTAQLRNWLLGQFAGKSLTIKDDGTIQVFTGENLKASAKRRGKEQREAYAGLDALLENALYDDFEEADARHKTRVAGQNIYYAAAKIGQRYFSVRFKVDIPLKSAPAYKDHKITEIEIAPSLYAAQAQKGDIRQDESAIRGISMRLLKGEVKPSGLENGVLFQSAFHGSPHKFDKFSLDHIGAGEGNQAHGWGLYFAKDKGISELYRRELSNRKNRNKIQFLINGEEASPEIAEKLNNLSSYTLDALVNDGDTSSLKNEIATIITEKKGDFQRFENYCRMYREQIERISANPKLSIAALARGFSGYEKDFFQSDIQLAQQAAQKAGRKTSIQDLKADFESALKEYGSAAKRVKDKIDFWTSFDVDALTVKSNKGQLFEVDIPEDDVLLDEQKLFKDQPEVVQKVVRDYVESLEDTLENQRDLLSHGTSENEYYAFFGRHSNDIRMRAAKDYFLRRANGEAIYKLLMCGHDLSAKRASLWLNDHGIKGITYYVSEDGRCYVIFDDKAVKVLDTFYQESKPIEVDSTALGVAEGASIKEYIQAAKKYHDQLKYESENGKPVIQPQLDKAVRFSGKGWKKNAHGGADIRKWQLFPCLHQIIENSKLIESSETSGRKDDFVKAHWLESQVVLDGQAFNVGLTLLEDVNGNLFYNLTPSETGAIKTTSSSQLETRQQSRGHEELLQDDSSSVEGNISPDADGVNLVILKSATPQGTARGGIRQMDDGRYIVGLFKSRNASTVLHESAHFWLSQLREAMRLGTAPEWVSEAWGKLEKSYGYNGLEFDPDSWRNVQERFARDFEAYAREGKAPSWELQSAFNRFRNWLTEIYRSIKSLLGAEELSPEVREVFDTLLATEDEIAQSQRAVETAPVMEKLGEEVAPELWDRYQRAVEKARSNASAIIANRRLVARRAAERNFREEAAREIDASETYQLIARVRESGIPFYALKQSISEDLAYKLREKWRAARNEGNALIRKGGTLDILDVAAEFDADTAHGLACALLETPTRREAINQAVEKELQAWDAEFDAELEYSSAYDEVLAIELEALTGKKQASGASLRREMEERAGLRKMSQVDAEYRSLKARLRSDEKAARKAWNAAKKDTAAQWREKLAALKEQERLRRQAIGADYRTRMERDKIIRLLRKVGSSKSIPYEYLCQIRRLLGHWRGLGTDGQKLEPQVLRSLPALDAFLAEQAGVLGDTPFAPDWILNTLNSGRGARFADLNIQEMRELKDLIRTLAHAGRTSKKMLADREGRRLADVAKDCAKAMNKLNARSFISERAGLLQTLNGALRKGLSSITSMRFLARWMDGFNDHGPNSKAWFRSLQGSRSEELLILRDMDDKLRGPVQALLARARWARFLPLRMLRFLTMCAASGMAFGIWKRSMPWP